MRRCVLFSTLTLLAMALCLATHAAMLCSRSKPRFFTWVQGTRIFRVTPSPDDVRISILRDWPSDIDASLYSANAIYLQPVAGVFTRDTSLPGVAHFTGRAYIYLVGRPAGQIKQTDVSMLMINWLWPQAVTTSLALLLCSLWLLSHFRRRRRLVQNRCLTCGYDLRASPTRCPECGTPKCGTQVAPSPATTTATTATTPAPAR